jgi:hypothetical protein
MKDIDLGAFAFSGAVPGEIPDLRSLDDLDKTEMLMSGVDVSGRGRSGTYLQIYHGKVH